MDQTHVEWIVRQLKVDTQNERARVLHFLAEEFCFVCGCEHSALDGYCEHTKCGEEASKVILPKK